MHARVVLSRRTLARAFVWLGAASTGVACSQAGTSSHPGATGSALTGGAGGSLNDAAGTGTSAGRGTGASAGHTEGAAAGQSGKASGGAGVGQAGRSAAGGAGMSSGASGAPSNATSRCDDTALVWRSANKTNYTSYPDPGSEECVKYNGCMWAGQFAACDAKETETWVSEHDIVAAFPDFDALKLHDLCLRQGSKAIVVTVLDTCGDSDCGGCCTQNRGSADELIDVESYTDARWGVPDGAIEWADLGATTTGGCQ